MSWAKPGRDSWRVELNRVGAGLASPLTRPRAVARRARLGLAGWRMWPVSLKRLFVPALEIPPNQHRQIQAAFQQHLDNSVSQTIKLPHDATRDDIAHADPRAGELSLNGVPGYRYGSKSSQVLELGAEEKPLHCDRASRCDPQECRV